MKTALIVFVKNIGYEPVKSRIGHEVGSHMADAIYGELLQATRQLCDGLSHDIHVYYSHHIDHNDAWTGIAKARHLQAQDPDLGRRMKAAFEDLLPLYHKVAIIGSDCPYLSPAQISEAFAALDGVDVVLGPSNDGGYYLLGMRSMAAPLFEDISWSTSEVLGQSLDKLWLTGKSFVKLDYLDDIDLYADYERWKNRL
ncbi:MAG TPA: TIGR04282 family arsenosugar biosynthesis glycosyltransferase [Saprospiraceae bacterium]|nr:TIGR04282 family arsenosugar biosynthesis glycosyltransferase [Saprospiraceae bacterium]